MELVFATAKEVDSGGRDNEGDAHSAAGGGGVKVTVLRGSFADEFGVAVVDESGGAKMVFLLGT